MQLNSRDRTGKKVSNVRTLTIQPKIRINRLQEDNISPEIKLCGNWLNEWGFTWGNKVTVTNMGGRLIIELKVNTA